MGAICTYTLSGGVGLTSQTDYANYYGCLCSYTAIFDDGSQHFDQFGMDVPKNLTESERLNTVAQILTDHLNDEFPGTTFSIQDTKQL